jgi:hypothetical protein
MNLSDALWRALACEIAPALGDVFPHPFLAVFVRARRASIRERCAGEKPLVRNLVFDTHGPELARQPKRGA